MLVHVSRTQILGTNCTVFSAWEPQTEEHFGHTTQTTIDGHTWGRIDTRPLPADLAALVALSQERSDAVRAYQQQLYNLCHEIICESVDDLDLYEALETGKAHNNHMGEIDLYV